MSKLRNVLASAALAVGVAGGTLAMTASPAAAETVCNRFRCWHVHHYYPYYYGPGYYDPYYGPAYYGPGVSFGFNFGGGHGHGGFHGGHHH